MASYKPIKQGGAGVMHWPSHCTAFYAQWVVRYMHPRKSPWKTILRSWIRNTFIGDGTILAACDNANTTKIPETATYMRACMEAFESLNIKQYLGPADRTCLGEPLFYNNRFTIQIPRQSVREWSHHLGATHIRDLIDESGQEHNDNQWSYYFYTLCPPCKRHTPRAHEWVNRRTAELAILRAAVPPEIWAAATRPRVQVGEYAEVINTTRATGVYVKIETANGGVTLKVLKLDTQGRPHDTGLKHALAADEHTEEVEVWDDTPSIEPPVYGSVAIQAERPDPLPPPRHNRSPEPSIPQKFRLALRRAEPDNPRRRNTQAIRPNNPRDHSNPHPSARAGAPELHRGMVRETAGIPTI
jgi:hypothetical protein